MSMDISMENYMNEYLDIVMGYNAESREYRYQPHHKFLQEFFMFMRKESNRLKTFTERDFIWPYDVSAKLLAKEGFIYWNYSRIQCIYCKGIVRGGNNEPIIKHSHQYCYCPYINGVNIEEIP